ncbi:MAG: hypothetical protein KDC83_10780 [Flavobacteriales bacterium]|nr:hypothetical protein [Flavobacteriales bacterium]
MSLAAQIETTISKLKEGSTFTYQDLGIEATNYAAAAKALERLQKKGKIRRLSKGIFYLPEQSVFGELKPTEAEVIKTYLFQDGKRVAYLTGTYLYNQMKLTLQVPNTWKVASYNNRILIDRQTIKARPVKAYVEVSEKNYRQLGFLDALKDWNSIPDMNSSGGISILLTQLKKLTDKETNVLKQYALKYPPRVRAFLGALLEQQKDVNLADLRESLNPLSTYKIRLKPTDLLTAPNWNIV